MKDLVPWVGFAVVVAGLIMLVDDIARHLRARAGRPIPVPYSAQKR